MMMTTIPNTGSFGYRVDQGLANDLNIAANNPLDAMFANPLTADYASAINSIKQVKDLTTAQPIGLSALSTKNNGTLKLFTAQGFKVIDDNKNSPAFNQEVTGFDAMGNAQYANMPQGMGAYNFGQTPVQNFGQAAYPIGGMPQTYATNGVQYNGSGGTNGNLAAFGLPSGTNLSALSLGNLSGLLSSIAQGSQNQGYDTNSQYYGYGTPNSTYTQPQNQGYDTNSQYGGYGSNPNAQYDYNNLLAASTAADTMAYGDYTTARRNTAPTSSWDAPATTRTRSTSQRQSAPMDSSSLETLLPSLVQLLIPMLSKIINQQMGPVSSSSNYLDNTRYVQPEPTFAGLGPSDRQLNAMRNLGNLGR